MLVIGAPTILDAGAWPIRAAAGSTTISLLLGDGGAPPAAGQMLLLHQTSGAEAGRWEARTIATVSGSTVTTTAPLAHAYVTAESDAGIDRAQAVTFPEYTTVTVAPGGALSAPPWNGSTGGILALRASGKVSVATAGGISMAGAGFPGGVSDTHDLGAPYHKDPGASYALVGRPGPCFLNCAEGIGAPNAGGGAGGSKRTDCAGSGGGGGSHATAGTGGGVSTCSPALPGGAPGLVYGDDDLSRIFFGSGGGAAGYSPDPALGRGGAGGGIVILEAKDVVLEVAGAIVADGAAGTKEHGASGTGGGGAGGSILLRMNGGAITGASNVSVVGGAAGALNVPGQPQIGGAGGRGRVFIAP